MGIALISAYGSRADDQFVALRGDLAALERQREQVLQEAYRANPTLEHAQALFKEARDYDRAITQARIDTMRWISQQPEPEKLREHYNNLRGQWAESQDYANYAAALVDPVRKPMIEELLHYIQGQAGEQSPTDEKAFVPAFLERMKAASEQASLRYRALSKEHPFPDFVIKQIGDEIKMMSMESLAEGYLRRMTPEAVRALDVRIKEASKRISEKYPDLDWNLLEKKAKEDTESVARSVAQDTQPGLVGTPVGAAESAATQPASGSSESTTTTRRVPIWTAVAALLVLLIVMLAVAHRNRR